MTKQSDPLPVAGERRAQEREHAADCGKRHCTCYSLRDDSCPNCPCTCGAASSRAGGAREQLVANELGKLACVLRFDAKTRTYGFTEIEWFAQPYIMDAPALVLAEAITILRRHADAVRPRSAPSDALREWLTQFVERERGLIEQRGKGGQSVGRSPCITPSVLKELERMLRDSAEIRSSPVEAQGWQPEQKDHE